MLINQILRTTLRKYGHNKSILNSRSIQKIQNYTRVQTLTSREKRDLHTSHSFRNLNFVGSENQFVYNVINKGLVTDKLLLPNNQNIKTEQDFNTLLNRDWRRLSASEVVEAFKKVEQYCIDHNIDVSDPRFDGLVDGLVDHCDKLTDDELLELLRCISNFPKTSGYMSHNYHDIWSCLDDICCWRMQSWDIDKMFTFADAWYRLSMSKVADFTFEVLDKLVKKADKLTKNQLVQVFFYFNVCRRKSVDFEYEAALEHKINEMNIDEMAVIALGYFKTKSKIKVLSVQQAIIQEVTKKSIGIHEITLSAIMKALRFSNPTKLIPDINRMLDSLCPELDRFSELCCLHIALLSTGLQTYHKNTLSICAEKLVQDLPNTRIKEIERILNVLTMFDFHPKTTPDIFQAAYEELHKNSRLAELNQYPKCLPSALNYLSLRGIYSSELMNRVLDLDFIHMNYGKQPKMVPRELLSLDACIDVEYPDYNGNRLPPDIRYKLVKWHTEFAPSYKWKKLTAIDQLLLDTIATVKKIVGNEELLFIHHILPHFPRADVIICQDTTTEEFIEPIGFQRYILGDVMVPFNDGTRKWYAIVVLGWNNTIRDTSLPLGHSLMKFRHLKKIGYNPIPVIWNQFMNLSPNEKLEYIKQKLDCRE